MSEPQPPAPFNPVALRQRRDRTIEVLCDHFARDHLDADELERLIDRAHQATTPAQLDGLLAGLPALTPAPDAGGLPARPARPAAPAGPQQRVLAVMGGAERRGGWTPAARLRVVAVMGGVVLDFREARLDPGVTEVDILAVLGGVLLIVPPEVRVEASGSGFLGGFEHTASGHAPPAGDGPLLRVTGTAVLGGVQILERAPGEEPDDPRTAVHERRRALREERARLRAEMRRLGRGGPPPQRGPGGHGGPRGRRG